MVIGAPITKNYLYIHAQEFYVHMQIKLYEHMYDAMGANCFVILYIQKYN